MIPKVMILAAGVGSRLKPLTNKTPKALIPYNGKPMIQHVLEYMLKQGIKEVVINIHHHAEQIIEYIEKNNFGLEIQFSDERNMLMDTGGGIMKAREFFKSDEPFLVHNVDVITDIDISAMMYFHIQHRPLATLAVKERNTSRSLLLNSDNQLCGWRDNSSGKTIIMRSQQVLTSYGFSGIHILDPKIFKSLPINRPFSITESYLDLSANNTILGFDHSSGIWTDMAHPSNFPEMG